MASSATTTRSSNTNSSTTSGPGRPPQASPQPIHIYTSPGGGGGGGMVYPVASSGRGFVARLPSRPSQDQSVAFQPRGPPGMAYRPAANLHLLRQHPTAPTAPAPHHQHLHQHYIAPPTPVKGLNQMKVSSSPTPPVPDSNGYKNSRDRGRDDALVVLKDRKVRISDGASLYVLCRSWLRNGFPDESQPHYGESTKSLSRPLPIPVIDTHSPKEEDEENAEDEVEEESVDHLSSQDLLKMHINRAKRVRARLREGRLKRIARYKSRLALLLPPPIEQFRNDNAAGN